MQGKIIKGIAGFYYVHVVHSGIYECKAKGIFRNKNIKPLVGDNVLIDVVDEADKKGNVVEILPRNSELVRPAVANVDQALVVFSVKSPIPNFNLLDRFLLIMEEQNVDTVICFNKSELISDEEKEMFKNIYKHCEYRIIFTSTYEKTGINDIMKEIENKTTVFAGPSGVGKSSILNMIMPDANSKTGTLSEKVDRGKHTTRHTEIFNISGETYILDTPGFSSIYIPDIEKEELGDLYPEFRKYEAKCRFTGCSHISEPDCGVKDALEKGRIHPSRYDNYILIYNEISERKKY